MHQHGIWPVISLNLAQGHRVHILFRNYEDDSGWDYLLQQAGSDVVITAASLEGGFHGPALSWPSWSGQRVNRTLSTVSRNVSSCFFLLWAMPPSRAEPTRW